MSRVLLRGPGGPLESAAFDQATPALSDEELLAGGEAMRSVLR
jgi:hypothetical protein